MKRRQIKVSLPESQPGLVSMGNMRLQPNYSLNSIRPNPYNPRREDLESYGLTLDAVKAQMRREGESLEDFHDRVEAWINDSSHLDQKAKSEWYKLLSLAVSITEDGLNQPVAVRLVDPSDSVATLISGERRFLASWLGNLKSVHAIVRVQNDSEASAHALIENTQRSDLSFRATVTTLISMQAEAEKPFTVTQVMRLGSYSRGGASYVQQALNLPLDHPVHKAIQSGEATKPYHIKKILDELKAAEMSNPGPSAQASSQTPVDEALRQLESRPTDGNTSSSSRPKDPVQPQAKAGEAESDVSRPKFKAQTTDEGQPQQDEAGITASTLNAQVEPSAPNNTPVSPEPSSWDTIRDWLAKACLDAHSINGSDYQRLADDLEQIQSADEVLAFIQKAAALSVDGE